MNNTKNNKYNVIIIGAGASGLMAAIIAARKGARVLILEHKDKIGKKILATGNGKCNFTNQDMQADYFRGNKAFVENALSSFSMQDTIAFFEQLGVVPKEKNGYYYPYSEQASSIVDGLKYELDRLRVEILCNSKVSKISKKNQSFELIVGDQRYFTDKLVIATGLLANPKLGSDGSIFNVVKGLGHSFSPIVPALCGFYCGGFNFKKVSGVRCDGKVTAIVDGTGVAEDYGEIQFTDYGLSGIPVFQISRFLSSGISEKKKCQIELSLFPDLGHEQLCCMLENRKSIFTKSEQMAAFFNGFLNQKLAYAIIEKAGISLDYKIGALSEKEINKLAKLLHSIRVDVNKSRDYEFAQVCAGGIKSDEIDVKTLESRIVDDLYFAGEILDVDGPCGGYNLQWAWSSGYIVGNNIG